MFATVDKKFGDIKMKYYTYENPTVLVAAYDAEGDNLALLIDDDGMKEKLTVNISEEGSILQKNHVAVKNYSEGEGLAKALQEAGVGTIISEDNPIGWGTYSVLKLSFDADALYQKLKNQ